MKAREYLRTHDREFLEFFRGRFPIYHLSNVFFRDIHYGVIAFLAEHGMRVSYPEAEDLAQGLVEKLEHDKVFHKIDRQTWVVRHPDYKTKTVKAPASSGTTASAAKPAA